MNTLPETLKIHAAQIGRSWRTLNGTATIHNYYAPDDPHITALTGCLPEENYYPAGLFLVYESGQFPRVWQAHTLEDVIRFDEQTAQQLDKYRANGLV